MLRLVAALWGRLGRLRYALLWLINPKYVVGVSAIIVHGDGKVWLQQHRFWEQQCWGFPGGYMHAGEAPAEALRREIREETGFEIEVGRVIRVETFFARGLTLFYVARIVGGQKKLDMRELVQADFFEVESLPKPLLNSHRLILTSFIQQGGLHADWH